MEKKDIKVVINLSNKEKTEKILAKAIANILHDRAKKLSIVERELIYDKNIKKRIT